MHYGVEAARQLFVKELYDKFISYDGYVNPRNILLLADFLFRHGTYLGTTYTGMKHGNMGFFTAATFERSSEAIEEAAAYAKTEEMTSVSAAIAVGKAPILGTGYFDIQSNPTFEDEEGEIIEDPMKTQNKEILDKLDVSEDLFAGFDEQIQSIGDIESIDQPETDNDPEADFQDTFLDREAPVIVRDLVSPALTKEEEEGPSKVIYDEGDVSCPITVEEGPSALLQEKVALLDLGPPKQPLAKQELETVVFEIPSDVQQAPLDGDRESESVLLYNDLPILYL
jgi:hypothetical protein